MNLPTAEIAKWVATVIVAVVAGLTANSGDVATVTVDQLRDQARDAATYNCERANDLRNDIRETLLIYVPPKDQDEALSRFELADCSTVIDL